MKRLVVLLASLCLLVGAFAPPALAGPPARRAVPPAVHSLDDQAKGKLDTKLRAALAHGSNATVAVFATVIGNPSRAMATLQNAHAARTPNGMAALIVGRIKVQQLPKLAGQKNVVKVNLVQLTQTGKPLGNPDPDIGRKAPSAAARRLALSRIRATDVPFPEAPPLKGSNFDALKKLDLLDAKTHDFAEAWNMGFDGTGSTVSILDGGSDWGHPDLIGTWLTAPSGWPQAYDPFDTLILLVDPGQVDQGLTWYTPTQAATGTPAGAGRLQVTFATRTGPSRNFAAPDGTASHTYTFPAAWTKSGSVRLGSHPDDHLLGLYGERPAFLVTDPNVAGVYDTVYVDLNDDHDFSDEKPVTKASPVSYRDMNGDGYTDLSGGLVYYISDGTTGTALPGGPESFGLDLRFAPGAMLAWTGDFDPAIEGHGTLTASNVVGQGVINAGAPTFADVHAPGHTYPGAVIGGAPKAKAAPMGDIYFGFDFSTQFAYFLTNQDGIDVISNSYGSSDADNDGFDAASQEAALWSQAFGVRTTSVHSTGNGAPGYGTTTPPKPFTGIAVGASTQFGGTGWDSIKNASQITDNDVIPWSDRGPGATGSAGVDVVGDGAFSPGDLTLNDVLDGAGAWATWGGTSRSTPVVVGATALVYQAQRKLGPIGDGFALQARAILKSSALDLGYDSFTQGAGSVQAGEAVKATLGRRAVVTPDEWRPGDYRGDTIRGLPAPAAGRGHRQSDVQARRQGQLPDLRPLPHPGRLDDGPLDLAERQQGESEQLQLAGLPDQPHEPGQSPSERRPDGHPGDLSALRVRPERGLRQRPALDAARLRLDRHQPRRPAVDRQEPQRRRQPQGLRADRHRRRPADRLQALRDPEGRVRAVHLPADRQRRPPGDGPRPGPADAQRAVPRADPPGAEPRPAAHPLHVRDRLLQERRLVVDHHPQDRPRVVQRPDPRPDRHAGRHVRGRGRRPPRQAGERRAGGGHRPGQGRPRPPTARSPAASSSVAPRSPTPSAT